MGEHVCVLLPHSLNTFAISNTSNSVTNARLWRQAQAYLPPDESDYLFHTSFFFKLLLVIANYITSHNQKLLQIFILADGIVPMGLKLQCDCQPQPSRELCM